MRLAILIALVLAGCQRAQPRADSPGSRLEAVAMARGLAPDPTHLSPIGSWAADTDHLCVTPADHVLRIGAVIDYGDGQGCAASGSAEQRGDQLRVSFGECRFDARFDGDRIAFPAELPAPCVKACTGRASLAALTVERLSDSASEAAMLRGPNGKLLCGTQ